MSGWSLFGLHNRSGFQFGWISGNGSMLPWHVSTVPRPNSSTVARAYRDQEKLAMRSCYP
jgi:hypothetical protein